MRLAELVETSRAVGATRSRKKKVAALVECLRALGDDERIPAVSMLAGELRQGRIGVGYAAAFGDAPPPASAASLEVTELDRWAAAFTGIEGQGAQARRKEALDALMRRATADEQDFLRRLLTGELRQGALEAQVLEAVAAATEVALETARRALMFSGDLGETTRRAFAGGAAALAEVRLTVMTPVRPMLASPGASATDAIDPEAARPAIVDQKHDGARVQVHRRGHEVKVFTRNLNDVTDRMGDIVAFARTLDVRSVVLDGEAMALRDDGSPEPFQETMRRFGSEDRAMEAEPLQPFFFDVLEHDGEALVDAALHVRLARLDALVPASRRVTRTTATSAAQVEAFSQRTVAAGHEGVIVKDANAPYEAGRRGAAWRKLKPVYTFDLVVLGVEWGSGRREGKLSNIHLGARADVGDGGDDDDRGFVMVGKTFKGMTDDMLAWQTERFLALETRRTKSTVFVAPVQVVEVPVDGVQASSRYPGGLALRFARVRGYREDKSAAEADTLASLRGLLRGGSA